MSHVNQYLYQILIFPRGGLAWRRVAERIAPSLVILEDFEFRRSEQKKRKKYCHLHLNRPSHQLSWRAPWLTVVRQAWALVCWRSRPGSFRRLMPCNAKQDCDASKKESFVIAAHESLGRPKPSSSRLGAPSNHVLSPLCFHGLTNCFSRNSFILITICVTPGVWVRSVLQLCALALGYHLLLLCHSNVFKRLQIPPSALSIRRSLIFKHIQIPFSSTRLFSHLHKTPGCRGQASSL